MVMFAGLDKINNPGTAAPVTFGMQNDPSQNMSLNNFSFSAGPVASTIGNQQ